MLTLNDINTLVVSAIQDYETANLELIPENELTLEEEKTQTLNYLYVVRSMLRQLSKADLELNERIQIISTMIDGNKINDL